MDTPAPRWHTREDSGIRLDRELRWWHDGEPIEHPNIIEAFNRGVRITEDGRTQLVFGNDWCFIEVEDCAYGVVAVDDAGDGRLSVRLSDRTAEWLEPASVALGSDGVLTCAVKGGKARARFRRDAHFELAGRLQVDPASGQVRLGGVPTQIPASALD